MATIKHHHFSMVEKEQREVNEAKAREVAEAFQAEIAAVFAKYKCEVSVREGHGSYETWVEGIDVDFDGIYEDGETVRPYFTIEFGSNMS